MKHAITVIALSLLTGCQAFETQRVTCERVMGMVMTDCYAAQDASEQTAPMQEQQSIKSAYLSQQDQPIPRKPVSHSRAVPLDTQVDPISAAAQILGEQLISGLSEARVKRFPMTILPFGALPGHSRYAQVGERVSESLFFALQANEYNLIDYRVAGMPDRAMPDVSQQQLGDLRQRNRIYFVLVGNYGQYADGLVFNARVLDTTTRQVLAAGQVHVATQLLEGRLPGYDPLMAADKGMIVETGGVPQ